MCLSNRTVAINPLGKFHSTVTVGGSLWALGTSYTVATCRVYLESFSPRLASIVAGFTGWSIMQIRNRQPIGQHQAASLWMREKGRRVWRQRVYPSDRENICYWQARTSSVPVVGSNCYSTPIKYMYTRVHVKFPLLSSRQAGCQETHPKFRLPLLQSKVLSTSRHPP